jgi:hypothetical protein
MASFEDDDDYQNFRFEEEQKSARRPAGRGGRKGKERDDSWDRDDLDLADVAPDDLGTVRCTECRKWIFEESIRCPYCKHLQLEDEQQRKPRWVILAAIAGILGMVFWLLIGVFDMLSWFHR